MAAGAPFCLSCLTTRSTELHGHGLLDTWRWERGVKWRMYNDLAYWHLRVDCHRRTWPADRLHELVVYVCLVVCSRGWLAAGLTQACSWQPGLFAAQCSGSLLAWLAVGPQL